jgi:carbamoyl-phosphate synthase large subunit
LREAGYETVMINCNPETVSTDYDTSDRLYFEPLTLEDVLHIYHTERCDGAIVQFGGQTPLNLSLDLERNGVRIVGTQPRSIERAEDRRHFSELATRLGLRQSPSGLATTVSEAGGIAERLGYPVLVRPSFVLGGRAMVIVYDRERLDRYMAEAVEVSERRPVLIDRYLEDAIEVDVDCISDGHTTVIGAIMEHVELAGIHSGDSACTIPAPTLVSAVRETIHRHTVDLARELEVVGLMNVQYAVRGQDVYVLEVNPRASRTVPFVSKAIGVPLAKLAALCMVGFRLEDMGFTREVTPRHWSVKESVFPFTRFPGADVLLSPEMKSTGEVMGMDRTEGLAFLKSQIAASSALPSGGAVFLSVRDEDKAAAVPLARDLEALGYAIYATAGTSTVLRNAGVKSLAVFSISKGRPNVLDLLEEKAVGWIINTPSSTEAAHTDGVHMRARAVIRGVPITTTIAGLRAALRGLKTLREHRQFQVCSLQEYQRHAPRVRLPRVGPQGAATLPAPAEVTTPPARPEIGARA